MIEGHRKDVGILAAVLMVFFLVSIYGCAKKTPTAEGEAQKVIPTEEVTSGGQAAGQGGNETAVPGIEESGLEGGAGAVKQKEEPEISEGRTSAPLLPIYFDFDRYNIRGDMVSRMEQNGRYLLDNPDIRIQVQGNCDERGTNEYNIALGEKRAKSAKDFLVNMGLDPNRIDTVSFGEERPLDPGHNEDAWAKNRRDDFVIISNN